MAINPMEREGCWLCDGVGAIETRKADESYEDVTVGCPVCLQNDLEWERDNALRERDEYRELLREERVRIHAPCGGDLEAAKKLLREAQQERLLREAQEEEEGLLSEEQEERLMHLAQQERETDGD